MTSIHRRVKHLVQRYQTCPITTRHACCRMAHAHRGGPCCRDLHPPHQGGSAWASLKEAPSCDTSSCPAPEQDTLLISAPGRCQQGCGILQHILRAGPRPGQSWQQRALLHQQGLAATCCSSTHETGPHMHVRTAACSLCGHPQHFRTLLVRVWSLFSLWASSQMRRSHASSPLNLSACKRKVSYDMISTCTAMIPINTKSRKFSKKISSELNRQAAAAHGSSCVCDDRSKSRLQGSGWLG